MKRTSALIMSLLSALIFSITCAAKAPERSLNNAAFDPKQAITDGDVVMISTFDADSAGAQQSTEIYNAGKLDQFIEKMRLGCSGTLRIVKYARTPSKTWVNKLVELQADGDKKIEVDYDVYSDPDAFIPLGQTVFYSLIKKDNADSVWYGIRYKQDEKQDTSLISFNKSDIRSW